MSKRLSDEALEYADGMARTPAFRLRVDRAHAQARLDALSATVPSMVAELRARRERDADLRALIDTAAKNCSECWFSAKHAYGQKATCDGDLTRGQCRAALLARFGLAKPEVEK